MKKINIILKASLLPIVVATTTALVACSVEENNKDQDPKKNIGKNTTNTKSNTIRTQPTSSSDLDDRNKKENPSTSETKVRNENDDKLKATQDVIKTNTMQQDHNGSASIKITSSNNDTEQDVLQTSTSKNPSDRQSVETEEKNLDNQGQTNEQQELGNKETISSNQESNKHNEPEDTVSNDGATSAKTSSEPKKEKSPETIEENKQEGSVEENKITQESEETKTKSVEEIKNEIVKINQEIALKKQEFEKFV